MNLVFDLSHMITLFHLQCHVILGLAFFHNFSKSYGIVCNATVPFLCQRQDCGPYRPVGLVWNRLWRVFQRPSYSVPSRDRIATEERNYSEDLDWMLGKNDANHHHVRYSVIFTVVTLFFRN